MRIDEIRCYPGQDYHLINMFHDEKQFAYSHSDSHETFEIYYLWPDKSTRYSRSYKLHVGEKSPIKYAAELAFLKEEFNKIDWDTLEVTNALTGEMSKCLT